MKNCRSFNNFFKVFISFLLFILSGCGSNNNNDKQLELKERELALKEKQFTLDSISRSQNKQPGIQSTNPSDKEEKTSQPALETTATPDAKFSKKGNTLHLTINNKDFLVEKDFVTSELVQESEKGKLAVASIYGASGGTTYSATLQKNGDIKIEQTSFASFNGQVETETRTIKKIKLGEY